MDNKLKRVVAIISLVLISVFTVSLILYLFNKDMLGGAIGDLALWSGGFGILFALVLYISRSFPSQQLKDEERERLYREAEEAELAAQATKDAECQPAEGESVDNESDRLADESKSEAETEKENQ